MTAEDNGVPENDDPFAYLYRSDGDDGAPKAAAPQQPGVPRTSYQQATQVGRHQYGQPRPQQQAPQQYGQQEYGQQSAPAQQYSSQLPHQAAQPTKATTVPPEGGGRAGSRAGAGAGGSRGGNRGVMFGAIAVVAAIVIGIGVALANGNDNKKDTAGAGAGATSSSSASASSSGSASASASATLPGKTDVSTMTLGGGAASSTSVTGGVASGGTSVALSAAGQSITWTVTVPTAGQYTFWVHYANGANNNSNPIAVAVNGKASSGKTINLRNWNSPQSDLSNAWQQSYGVVTLNAGSNTITLAYGGAGESPITVDQFALTAVGVTTHQWS